MYNQNTDDSLNSFDKNLDSAYRRALYIQGDFILQIDRIHPEYDQWLINKSYKTYTFLTAWNPSSQLLSQAENDLRHASLLQEVLVEHIACQAAESRDPGNEWPVEKGLMLFDIDLATARQLGHRYGQNAIVYGSFEKFPQLIWLL